MSDTEKKKNCVVLYGVCKHQVPTVDKNFTSEYCIYLLIRKNPCLEGEGDADDPEKSCETTVPDSVSAPDESSKAQTDEDPFRYRTDFPSVGVCLLINNKNFYSSTRMGKRHGTDVDAAAVKKTFENLGYTMMVFQDLTVKEMKEKLQSVAEEDHSKRASFVCVILSHGDEGVIFGTDGCEELDVLTRYFKGDKSMLSGASCPW
uniref:Caspase family p20 domain-containing protein n=1 Tax=Neogobius melanostomus TaxID=47308 RepID=A0A8C6WQY4_9GOBI